MSGLARRIIVLGLFLGVLTLALQPIASAPMPAATHSIVGSWVEIPTDPGQPPGPPRLFTFTSDGTLLRFGSGSGAGLWVGTGDRAVTCTFMALRQNANGDFLWMTKVRVKVTLNETYDVFTGSGRVDRLDAQGKPPRSFEFTTRATRMKVESP